MSSPIAPTEQEAFVAMLKRAKVQIFDKDDPCSGGRDSSPDEVTFWAEAGIGGSHRGLVSARFVDGRLRGFNFED